MLVIHSRIAPQANPDAELELTFEARSKSRLRCFTTAGEEVGLFLYRPSVFATYGSGKCTYGNGDVASGRGDPAGQLPSGEA